MFLIYKSWYDSLTSMREPDSGYDVVGYVESEKEAKAIVKEGGADTRPWNNQPMFKYEKIDKYIGS